MTPENYKVLFEILDSAVKIGLGALIGAAASVATVLIQNSLGKSREWTKRKFDALERSASEFDEIHTFYVNVLASYTSYCNLAESMPEAARGSLAKTRSLLGSNAKESMLKQSRLHGYLLLYGAAEVCLKLEVYFEKATVFYQNMKTAVTREDRDAHELIQHLGTELHLARCEVFKAFSILAKKMM